MTLTEQKFSEGMSTSEYIDQIKINKQPFRDIYDNAEIPAQVLAFFSHLPERMNLAVFTADWCGDAMSTTPSILNLAEKCGKFNIKIFNRDDELELTNSYLPENRAGTVPVFAVYDSEMNEVARFIETASALVPDIDAMDGNIDQEMATENVENPDRARRSRRTPYRVARAGEWSKVIVSEFRRVVGDGVTRDAVNRPAIGGTKWPPGG
jgi:thiol-disulfide isomerase/thioredoxin